MKVSFSIITPIYNRCDTIARCIKSVQSQSFINYEHILIDDASTDSSFQIAQSFTDRDNRIKVFRFDKNKGTNAGRNFCINKATKKYILILDSDDYLVACALELIAQIINNNSEFRHFLFAADDRLSYYNSNKYLSKESNIVNFELWLGRNITGDFIHVVERELILLYPFDEYIRHHEGNNFLRMFKISEQQLFTKKTVTIRERNRKDSITNTPLFNSKESIQRSYLAVKNRIDWFANDMMLINEKLLYKDCHVAFKMGLMLSEYDYVESLSARYNIVLDYIEKIVLKFKLGQLILFGFIFYNKYFKF